MILPDHPLAIQPKEEISLWRYMDLTKLLSLLEYKKLHCPRADKFEDPFEGIWPRASREAAARYLESNGLPTTGTEILNLIKPSDVYISCWHASDHESAGMWKLYLKSDEGVAIRTTFTALSNVVNASPYQALISEVQYIDYDKAGIPLGNGLFPFTHKRLSFSHEREVRVLIPRIASPNEELIEEDAAFANMSVAPDLLIDEIYVSPSAPRWFGELVASLVVRYGLSTPVIRSTLYERPIY